MKPRLFMIYAHLILGSFFLPLMLLLPLTGSLYIWGYGGEIAKTEAFSIAEIAPEDKTAQKDFFREQFKKQNLNFTFESIRSRNGDFIFRPTSRTFYTASPTKTGMTFYKMEPDIFKRLNELHTGNGPSLMRWLESIFGVVLILVAFSGIWLAYTAKAYRRPMLISFAIGTAIIVFCLM